MEGREPESRSPSVMAVRGLVKRYGPRIALDSVDLTLPAGSVHGLLGANGAGKTTLLRIALGLVRPDAGTVELFGRGMDVPRRLDGVAGFVEAPNLYRYLSGRRNLEMLAALDGGGATGEVDRALDAVGLGDRAGDRVGGYSLGMRQRLGLAAALIRRPRLLVLDEPANGLDPSAARDLHQLVRALAEDGVGVLFSSHDMTEVDAVCDSVTILSRGRVRHSGPLAELRRAAPDGAYHLSTSNDAAAVTIAAGVPGIRVVLGEAHVCVEATERALDTYVVALGRAGVAVRRLTLATPPLEQLFFRLTEEPSDDDATPRRAGADSPPEDPPDHHGSYRAGHTVVIR